MDITTEEALMNRIKEAIDTAEKMDEYDSDRKFLIYKYLTNTKRILLEIQENKEKDLLFKKENAENEGGNDQGVVG